MSDNKEQTGGPVAQQQAELIKLALEQTKEVFKKLPLLGPICFLAMNSSAHRFMFIADFEWRILPPVVFDQAKVYMREEQPIAFASWAFLSEEAAERYRKIGRLAPKDWKSGDEAWLIDVIAPFGSVEEIVKDLKTNTPLAGKTTKMLGPRVGEQQGTIEF